MADQAGAPVEASLETLMETLLECAETSETWPLGQHREEDLTPAELRELKEHTAALCRVAYALPAAYVHKIGNLVNTRVLPSVCLLLQDLA
jgi:hypothetical protein